jgi:hypothetical protein
MFSASSLLGHFNLPITRPAGGERIVLTPNNELSLPSELLSSLDLASAIRFVFESTL